MFLFSIGALRSHNNFSAYTSISGMPVNFQGETTWIPDEAKRKLTIEAILKQESPPHAFLKHQNFLDFSEVRHKLMKNVLVAFLLFCTFTVSAVFGVEDCRSIIVHSAANLCDVWLPMSDVVVNYAMIIVVIVI